MAPQLVLVVFQSVDSAPQQQKDLLGPELSAAKNPGGEIFFQLTDWLMLPLGRRRRRWSLRSRSARSVHDSCVLYCTVFTMLCYVVHYCTYYRCLLARPFSSCCTLPLFLSTLDNNSSSSSSYPHTERMSIRQIYCSKREREITSLIIGALQLFANDITLKQTANMLLTRSTSCLHKYCCRVLLYYGICMFIRCQIIRPYHTVRTALYRFNEQQIY